MSTGEWLKHKAQYRPMEDPEGVLQWVHKGAVLGRLREGWTLKLKSASLILKTEAGLLSKRIHLEGYWRDSEKQYLNLIEHLEQGWVFGIKKSKK